MQLPSAHEVDCSPKWAIELTCVILKPKVHHARGQAAEGGSFGHIVPQSPARARSEGTLLGSGVAADAPLGTALNLCQRPSLQDSRCSGRSHRVRFKSEDCVIGVPRAQAPLVASPFQQPITLDDTAGTSADKGSGSTLHKTTLNLERL